MGKLKFFYCLIKSFRSNHLCFALNWFDSSILLFSQVFNFFVIFGTGSAERESWKARMLVPSLPRLNPRILYLPQPHLTIRLPPPLAPPPRPQLPHPPPFLLLSPNHRGPPLRVIRRLIRRPLALRLPRQDLRISNRRNQRLPNG